MMKAGFWCSFTFGAEGIINHSTSMKVIVEITMSRESSKEVPELLSLKA